jgi:hypothetical protein
LSVWRDYRRTAGRSGAQQLLPRRERRALEGQLVGEEVVADVLLAEDHVGLGHFGQEEYDGLADQPVPAAAEEVDDLPLEVGDGREVADARLLAQLAEGRLEVGLARVDVALGEVPVPAVIEQQEADVAGLGPAAVEDQEARRSFLARHGQLLTEGARG